MKIVINACHGGFGLSEKAFRWLAKNKGWEIHEYEKGKDSDIPKSARIIDFGEKSFGSRLSFNGDAFSDNDIKMRKHPDVIEVVETLGEKANGPYAKLKIIQVPNGVKVKIEEYDGYEHVAEVHRTWG